MNAAAIIEQIKHLPPTEQEQVVEFVQTLETRRPWSGGKLTEFEKKMVETNDPAEARRLKEQIVAGFFGDEPDAYSPAAQRASRPRGALGRPGARSGDPRRAASIAFRMAQR